MLCIIMQSVVILSVVMLSVFMLRVIMLSVIILIVVMLTVIILSVIMQSVMSSIAFYCLPSVIVPIAFMLTVVASWSDQTTAKIVIHNLINALLLIHQFLITKAHL
jgi:hypothetical protein